MSSLWDIIKNADSVADLISDLIKKDPTKPTSNNPSFPAGNATTTDLIYLHPKVRKAAQKALLECYSQGYSVTVVETYRTLERQAKLYAQGRSEPGQIVTKAESGESYHNYGLALDISPVNDAIVSIFENCRFEWGGRWKSFKNTPHFQMTLGYSVSQLKSFFSSENNLLSVWKTIS
jgi:peptidoglycan L-alanyl-D-glutamate endopeptidase CwlK